MDRSTVYERSSTFGTNPASYSMNRSFISTSLVNDTVSYGDDLRKSRIQNLPNYKKTNLGNSLQFVVVFQTIEIQRLSNEVQILRVKLKQSERMLFNAQNYQVQIRELTEKCFSYERERQQYRDQLDNLNKICETLYHENQVLNNKLKEIDFSLKQKYESEKQKNNDLMQEIQKWKARYQASEKSKAKQLEDLRNLMECQRKSMIDREIRQITIRFQTERSNLQNEIRKLREILENRNREIDDYKQKCQKYEINIMELKNYENIIVDNENKIVLLNQQLMRLNHVLNQKINDIENYKTSQHRLKQQIKEQKDWEYQNQNLRANLDNKQKEIDQWKVRVSRLQDEAMRGKELSHYNSQLNNKLALASKQIDRLSDVLKNKLQEIEVWKKRLSDKDMELSRYKNLENQVARYESKFSMIQTQNDRINGILKTRLGEIDQWKNRYHNLEKEIGNFTSIQKERKNIENKLNNQIRLGEELQGHIDKLEKQNRALRNLQGQFKEAERANSMLNKQIDRLNNIIKGNNQEMEDYRIRHTKIQTTLRDFKAVEGKVRDFQNKIALLTQQIERLNTLIRNKNDDIQQLERQKLEMHQKITHYKSYEMKLNQNQLTTKRLNDQINGLRKDLENWQKMFKESDNKVRQMENNLFQSSQQRDKLNNLLRSKNNEHQSLRDRCSKLEDDSRKVNKLEQVCQQQHTKIMTYITDIQGLQRSRKQFQGELEKQKAISNEFAFKIIVLSSQIQRLAQSSSSANVMKSKEFQEMQESFMRLQSKMQSKNNQLDTLLQVISQLQNKISNLSREFNKLLKEAQRSQQETLLLLKKIEQYQEYAKKIGILGAEIDRLTIQNKTLDEDARRMRLKYANQIGNEKKEEEMNLVKLLMGVEIQSLRDRLSQREVSVQQMRKSILEPVRKV